MRRVKAQEAIRINKRRLPWWAVLIIVIVALGGGVAGGYALSYQQAQQSVLKTSVPKELAPVIAAYETVTNNYYKSVSTTKLTDGAIKGMLATLDDPYSVYLQNNDKTNLDDTISASFGGIGATVQQNHDSLSIASILPDTPAKKQACKSAMCCSRSTVKMSPNKPLARQLPKFAVKSVPLCPSPLSAAANKRLFR